MNKSLLGVISCAQGLLSRVSLRLPQLSDIALRNITVICSDYRRLLGCGENHEKMKTGAFSVLLIGV